MRLPDTARLLPLFFLSGKASAISGLAGLCVLWIYFGGGFLPAGKAGCLSWHEGSPVGEVVVVAWGPPEATAVRPRPGIIDRMSRTWRRALRVSGQVKLAWLPWLPSGLVRMTRAVVAAPWVVFSGYIAVFCGGRLIRAGP